MDISKYITNKDIQLSNDDINIEKLEKDIRKGYVLESEQESAIKNALENSNKESTSKYAELETKYNELEKSYNALEERNSNITTSNDDLRLQVEMVSQGFDKDKFGEIAQLRKTLYAEEKDKRRKNNIHSENWPEFSPAFSRSSMYCSVRFTLRPIRDMQSMTCNFSSLQYFTNDFYLEIGNYFFFIFNI